MRYTLGKYEIQIDPEDAHLVEPRSGFSFQVQSRHTANYERFYVKARRNPNGGAKSYLHRLVMSAKAHQHVDHINGDGLDNRKINLRLCDRSQNMANQRRAVGVFGFRGVKLTADGPNFTAILTVKNKSVTVNALPSAEAAAKVRDYLALDYFGDFAKLNFPESKDEWLKAKSEGRHLYARHADDCPKQKSRRKWCRCGAEVDGRHKCYKVSNANRHREAVERRAAREAAA